VDEELIFSTIQAQRNLVDTAVRQTKAKRSHQARRAHLEPDRMRDVTPEPGEQDAVPAPEGQGNPLLNHTGFAVEEWYDD
jgi:putative transposase